MNQDPFKEYNEEAERVARRRSAFIKSDIQALSEKALNVIPNGAITI